MKPTFPSNLRHIFQYFFWGIVHKAKFWQGQTSPFLRSLFSFLSLSFVVLLACQLPLFVLEEFPPQCQGKWTFLMKSVNGREDKVFLTFWKEIFLGLLCLSISKNMYCSAVHLIFGHLWFAPSKPVPSPCGRRRRVGLGVNLPHP